MDPHSQQILLNSLHKKTLDRKTKKQKFGRTQNFFCTTLKNKQTKNNKKKIGPPPKKKKNIFDPFKKKCKTAKKN